MFQEKWKEENYSSLFHVFKTDRFEEIGQKLYFFPFLHAKDLSANDCKPVVVIPMGPFVISSTVKIDDRPAEDFFAAKVFVQCACNPMLFDSLFHVLPCFMPSRGQISTDDREPS
jgi:hypothetical protein